MSSSFFMEFECTNTHFTLFVEVNNLSIDRKIWVIYSDNKLGSRCGPVLLASSFLEESVTFRIKKTQINEKVKCLQGVKPICTTLTDFSYSNQACSPKMLAADPLSPIALRCCFHGLEIFSDAAYRNSIILRPVEFRGH